MDFLKEIVTNITPAKEEYSKLNEIVSKIKNKIKIKKAVVELGGSGSKNTWSKGNHDIDLYVKFGLNEYKNKDISSILKKELKRHFKPMILHGSRDYFQIIMENYTVEIIPIMNIKHPREALNLTDISPFHCDYVKKHDKSKEIRLAKAFCRTNKCYGAESYIGGFSGYVLEILVIHYGSFVKLLKGASKWESRMFIGNRTDIENLNISKKMGPLVLIDPVDKNRNAAAALSYEKYNDFINACKKFLKNPKKDFFIERKFDEQSFIKKHPNKEIIILEAVTLNSKKDVMGAKLLKCFNYIKERFKLNGFNIMHSEWHWDEKKSAFFYLVFDNKEISSTARHYGPPASAKKGMQGFIKKWGKGNIKKDGARIYTDIKREFTKPKQYALHLTKNDRNIMNYVKLLLLR